MKEHTLERGIRISADIKALDSFLGKMDKVSGTCPMELTWIQTTYWDKIEKVPDCISAAAYRVIRKIICEKIDTLQAEFDEL